MLHVYFETSISKGFRSHCNNCHVKKLKLETILHKFRSTKSTNDALVVVQIQNYQVRILFLNIEIIKGSTNSNWDSPVEFLEIEKKCKKNPKLIKNWKKEKKRINRLYHIYLFVFMFTCVDNCQTFLSQPPTPSFVSSTPPTALFWKKIWIHSLYWIQHVRLSVCL